MEPREMTIGQHLLQHILEHCMEEKPYEACGILTGTEGRVLHAYATDNARRSPVWYEVDREQQEHVLRAAAEKGEELVAIYHSHPTSPAEPSLNDIRMAVHYPEAIRMIVSLAGPADIRAFLIREGKVHPVSLASPKEAAGQWHDLRTP
jgi:[CysO sulfur-carrier protein]-S-L-cysteine hydrolase